MMKPIVEYHDYRRYMRDFYEERKRTSAFTWREFAKLAGFVSPTYLKLVCDGKTSLSKPGVAKVTGAMNLQGFEADYFKAMVGFGNARKDSEKTRAFEEMEKIARANRVRVIDSETDHYYGSSLNPILRELAPLMPGAKPNEMAAKINGVVSAFQVREALRFLTRAGLLEESDGTFRQTSKKVKGSKEAVPLAMRRMHREMANLAVESIDALGVEERNVSGVTMGVDEETYARIVEEINACRKKVVEIANEARHVNRVYRVNFQLFPLTAKVEADEVKEG